MITNNELLNINNINSYTFNDNVFSFEGCVSIEQTDEYISPWRINFDKFNLFPFLTEDAGRLCSGVRLCFTTDATYVALEVLKVPTPVQIHPSRSVTLDIFINGKFNEQIQYSPQGGIVSLNNLQKGLKEIEIWLDPCFSFKFKKLIVNTNAVIYKTKNAKKRWIHYGSSISHSVQAHAPSKTWTSIVAREKNLHLTNLGFRGQCMLDPMMAKVIRDLQADYITLKIGINLHEGALSRRTFAPCAINLIETIREKHPLTPIVIISPIYCSFRDMEHKKNNCGFTLPEMREILKNIVETYISYGDKNIYYLSGIELFNEDNIKNHSEGLHPDGDGQFILGENFKNHIFDSILL